MIEKLAEEEQPKNKTKFLCSQQWPCEEAWWLWLRGDPELLSLMTSAEQAAGRAALVVLIKSENGQNTSNAQSVVSQPGPHTRYTSQVRDTPFAGNHCMCWVLSLLWALWARKQLHLA